MTTMEYGGKVYSYEKLAGLLEALVKDGNGVMLEGTPHDAAGDIRWRCVITHRGKQLPCEAPDLWLAVTPAVEWLKEYERDDPN